MHPASMEENIPMIEGTREKKLNESVPGAREEERASLLKKYHPDFIKEGMCELKVDVNKGDRTPNELADLV